MEADDKRMPRRRHLTYYPEILDSDDPSFLGRLIDMSTSGIMLLTETEVESDKLFNFEIKLPDEFEGKKEIHLKARSVWCKKDVNPDYFAAGFEIEDIGNEDEKFIVVLIFEYGFKK